MKIFKFGLFSTICLILCSCYEPNGTHHVYIADVNWTGAGDYAYGSSSRGLAVGLAEQDMFVFHDTGTYWHWTNVLDGEFAGPYSLTSVAQTFSMGWHEQSFLHGNLRGRTDNLDLFHTVQGAFGYRAANRVRPADSLTFNAGGINFSVKEICDMATPDSSSAWIMPQDDDSHLFLSVKACSSGNFCVAGVVEADFSPGPSHWWIKRTAGVPHVRVQKRNGSFFNSECMPITATRWSKSNYNSSVPEYLFLADPSDDEVLVFATENFKAGPLDSMKISNTRTIKDISADGMVVGSIHYSFLQVLWGTSSSNTLAHYTVVDGDMPTTDFMYESLPADVELIQGFGRGMVNNTTDKGYLMTFGNRAIKRAYRKDTL